MYKKTNIHIYNYIASCYVFEMNLHEIYIFKRSAFKSIQSDIGQLSLQGWWGFIL